MIKEKKAKNTKNGIIVDLNPNISIILFKVNKLRASQVAQEVNNLLANAGDKGDVSSIPGPGWSPRVGNGKLLQGPLFPRQSHGQEEPGGLQSLASQRVGDDWACTHTRKLNILIHDSVKWILKFRFILFKRHVLNKGHKKDKVKQWKRYYHEKVKQWKLMYPYKY